MPDRARLERALEKLALCVEQDESVAEIFARLDAELAKLDINDPVARARAVARQRAILATT